MIKAGIEACRRCSVNPDYFINRYLEDDKTIPTKTNPELGGDSNTNHSSYLSGINQAIAMLSAPEEMKKEIEAFVEAKAEAGEHVSVKEIRELTWMYRPLTKR